MKGFIAFLLITIGGYFASIHLPLPWWAIFAWVAVVSFMLKLQPKSSFMLGFIALACLWGGMALFINQENGGLLSDTIGAVFRLNGWGMIGVTTLFGGVLAGLSSASGSWGRQLFVTQKESVVEGTTTIEIPTS